MELWWTLQVRNISLFSRPNADLSLPLQGNVYIGELNNYCVRKVTISTGKISTIAGSCGTYGYSGDGGAATSALINGVADLTLDSSGTQPLLLLFFSYLLQH